MMNRKRVVALLLVLSVLLMPVGMTVNAQTNEPENSRCYTAAAAEKWLAPSLEGAVPASGENLPLTLAQGETGTFTAHPAQAGRYRWLLVYRAVHTAVAMDNTVVLQVDGAEYHTTLPTLWCDVQRGLTDRSGNDVLPEQAVAEEFCRGFLLDDSGINKSALSVELSAAPVAFTVTPQVQDVEIREVWLVPEAALPTYRETLAGQPVVAGADSLTIEAEQYALKSDSYIRASSVQKNTVTPYDTYKKRLNVLSGDAWNTAGQKVLWEFPIENAGWYRFGATYQQPSNTNLPVYRRIEVDGRVPFAEWDAYSFASTGSNRFKTASWQVDGDDAWVYLDKGTHTVALTVSVGALEQAYSDILALIGEINTLGSQLLKLTAGESDANRTWDMDAYMPQAQGTIYGFADRMDAIYAQLAEVAQGDPVFADDLKYAAELARKLAGDKKTIPNNTEMLCRGDNSATTYLIQVINNITAQSVSLDTLYVYGETQPQTAKSGFFRSVWESLKRFFYSFTPAAIADDYGVAESTADQLTVWVGQTPMCVNILQQMVDATYNKEHGTDIQLVVMPSEQKLILANAVGNNPDLVISSVAPYKYAIRGAAKNLLEYDDFLDVYTKDYSLESLVPMYYNGGVYGVNETRSFSVLFYRKDTLATLGLSVPETWDDVRAMMPTLLRNSMNFSLPTSGGGAYSIGAVAPFVLQNNGQIYADDGMSVAIDSENTLTALQEITDFYKIYGVQQSVASFFNSFRYNQIPIGIAGYDFYLQLSMAAPELKGLWDIALVPGTRQEDGSIRRDYGCNGSASMIFANSDKQAQAWNFLKWWLSSETQTEYSRRRQVGYGANYMWNSANRTAFETLPFSAEHKAVIREQFRQQQEVVEHPASYIVAREIGNVWNKVVISNGSLVDSVNSATILCNREFKRKLQEFGFVDENGAILKEYSTHALEELKRLKGGES